MNDLSKYEMMKGLMETADVLQWHSNSAIGAAIRMRKGGDVNHTGLILRLGEYEGFAMRRFTLEALEHGVVLNLLSRRLQDFNGKVYLRHLKPEHDGLRKEIGERALSMVGTPYDYPGIISEAFGNARIDMDKLFCSEFAWVAMTGKTEGEAPDPVEFEEALADWFIPRIEIL